MVNIFKLKREKNCILAQFCNENMGEIPWALGTLRMGPKRARSKVLLRKGTEGKLSAQKDSSRMFTDVETFVRTDSSDYIGPVEEISCPDSMDITSSSPMSFAQNLLKFNHEMMTVALTNSFSSPADARQAQPEQHQGAALTDGIERILDFAQRFEQLEKEKIAVKKRKLTVMECYQNEMLSLEKEKLEIAREQNEYKRIKLSLLETQDMRSRFDLWQRDLSEVGGRRTFSAPNSPRAFRKLREIS